MPKKKRGLYDNINARKKAGTSRSKKNTTISPEAYKAMQSDFGRAKKDDGGEMKMPKRMNKAGGNMAMVDMMAPRKRMGMNGGGSGRKNYNGGGMAKTKGNSKAVRGPCS
tara:strand:- start:10084 stop:10413 length:330 start_codon:yes stop_codon:yes gene_type:complete